MSVIVTVETQIISACACIVPRAYIISRPEELACKLQDPRTSWAIQKTTPSQKVFVVIIKADGLPDFEVPVSTITLRLRDGGASYVSCTIPDPTSYTSDILDRIDGRMHIYSGIVIAGIRTLEELIYANIQTVYFDQGSNNLLTLSGTRYATNSNPKTAALAGVSRISKDDNDRFTVRCSFDPFIKPGDTVTAQGETIESDLVIGAITAAGAYMDVEGIGVL